MSSVTNTGTTQTVGVASSTPPKTITFNVGGRQFTFGVSTLEFLGENVLSVAARRWEGSQERFIDADPDIFQKWIAPYVRHLMLPDIKLIKDGREKQLIIVTAQAVGILPIVEHLQGIDKPEGAFGAEDWKGYYDWEVSDIPALPCNVEFDPVKEVMVLIPKGLSINQFGEMIKNPKKGCKSQYRNPWDKILAEHGDTVVESSYWVAMSKDVIEGSRGKTRDQQLALATSNGGKVPTLLEAIVACGVENARTGNRILNDNPWTCTVCQELVQGHRDKLVVGGFSASGLCIGFDDVYYFVGVAHRREFPVIGT